MLTDAQRADWHLFNTYFFKTYESGATPDDRYQRVAGWTKRITSQSPRQRLGWTPLHSRLPAVCLSRLSDRRLLDKSCVFIPMNSGNLHWWLALVINPRQAIIPIASASASASADRSASPRNAGTTARAPSPPAVAAAPAPTRHAVEGTAEYAKLVDLFGEQSSKSQSRSQQAAADPPEQPRSRQSLGSSEASQSVTVEVTSAEESPQPPVPAPAPTSEASAASASSVPVPDGLGPPALVFLDSMSSTFKEYKTHVQQHVLQYLDAVR